MIEPTLHNVQVLLDRPRGEGMIVSCYADKSLVGYQSHWPARLKNAVAEIDQRLADDPEACGRFARDVAVIRRALGNRTTRRAQGMAVFSATDRDFLQVFVLNVPVRDALVLDEQPYLVPLLEAIHRQRRYLVVLTDSHRGRLYAAEWGRADLLNEIVEDVPRRQRSAGETWGKQQATIERHRKQHMLHYRKSLVGLVQKAWNDAPFRGLILLGEHETLAALRAALPASLAGRVVHEAPHSWLGRQPSITAKVQAVLETALRVHDERLVKELERRLRERSYCVAAGPQEVIDALRNGQVGYPGYVVLEPDHGEMAARCTGCGSVSTVMRPACPYCNAPCEKVNLWQEILLFAARHDIPTHVVENSGALARHGGVAAVLSRPGPWEPVAHGSRVERRIQP
jgi:hypothetical protein